MESRMGFYYMLLRPRTLHCPKGSLHCSKLFDLFRTISVGIDLGQKEGANIRFDKFEKELYGKSHQISR